MAGDGSFVDSVATSSSSSSDVEVYFFEITG